MILDEVLPEAGFCTEEFGARHALEDELDVLYLLLDVGVQMFVELVVALEDNVAQWTLIYSLAFDIHGHVGGLLV